VKTSDELLEDPIGDALAVESLPPSAEAARAVRHWRTPAIIGSAMLMQSLEGNVISNALPAMAKAFHEDPLRLNVAITMFLLATAVSLPLSGWIADKYGAKRIFMLSIVLFALSSAGCGFAQNLPQLIVGRLAQDLQRDLAAIALALGEKHAGDRVVGELLQETVAADRDVAEPGHQHAFTSWVEETSGGHREVSIGQRAWAPRAATSRPSRSAQYPSAPNSARHDQSRRVTKWSVCS